MNEGLYGDEGFPAKDEIEHPIPSIWRPVFRSIIRALAHHDYQLIGEIDSVEPILEDQAAHIRGNIASYGATLVDLSDETWESSVTIWMGTHWETLVDLWTAEEGRSDLCLATDVRETDSGFTYQVHMVYVP